MPVKKPISEWKHGTHGTYVNGCRCVLCRLASNAYKRALYHRDLAASRKRERERKRVAHRSVGDFDTALIQRDVQYRLAAAALDGELAELVAEQVADDVNWIKPDVPRHLRGRSFDESRWGGWGEADPAGGAAR
jgi:hypothetical protein